MVIGPLVVVEIVERGNGHLIFLVEIITGLMVIVDIMYREGRHPMVQDLLVIVDIMYKGVRRLILLAEMVTGLMVIVDRVNIYTSGGSQYERKKPNNGYRHESGRAKNGERPCSGHGHGEGNKPSGKGESQRPNGDHYEKPWANSIPYLFSLKKFLNFFLISLYL